MPGPPAPFVPTPLPNIGKSGDSPQGYSRTVTIEGKAVAIAGASFGSQGDMASKGTGGGLISSNTHGPTKFIGPGSMNVQIEGKNVQLLGDPMLNNCGPSGSPANAATMTGIIQAPGVMAVIYGDDKPCKECGKTHPLEAGEETLKTIEMLFTELKKALDAQKDQIREYRESTKEEQAKKLRLKQLEFKEQNKHQGKGPNPTERAELAALPGEISALETKIAALEQFFKTNAVLRLEGRTSTYTKGYMIGVMVCVCTGKKLAACSGLAPAGFAKAVLSAGFECASPLVDSGAAQEDWMCAAKQIMQKHAGHKPKHLIERLFYPMVEGFKASKGPEITFHVRIEDPVTKTLSEPQERTQEFKNGDTVPSCSKCQENLPSMYCKTNCG